MPELPEVETIIRGLHKEVIGRKITNVWTDFEKLIKRPKNFSEFKKEIIGEKIEAVRRRAKNILFYLSHQKILLIHQKLTGHLLLGKWQRKKDKWAAAVSGPLKDDPVNRFLHLIFWLDNKEMLALSDLRKFAKVELWSEKELKGSKEFQSLGPEPLKKSFTFEKFREALQQTHGKIKQVLMDQTVISGIGNIYSDEILWEAKIHPFRETRKLSNPELKGIYKAMKNILNKAIKFKGDSVSDYRLITGEKGNYQKIQKVYRKTGKPCPRNDGGIIQRIKIGGRSAHFCPVCQK